MTGFLGFGHKDAADSVYDLPRRFSPPNPDEKISRTMSRWIQHPALVRTLLMLFGLPNLLGQGFHVAIHHHHGAACEIAATICDQAHLHAHAESTPVKRDSCQNHRTSRAESSLVGRDTEPQRTPIVSQQGHDPHECSACQYFSTAQVLAKSTVCIASVGVSISPVASLPAAVFCERYLASSPRGPPVA